MTSDRVRLIIKPPGAYTTLRTLAEELHWQSIRTAEQPPNHPLRFQQSFLSADRLATIHYVEDDLAGAPYLHIVGLGRDEVATRIATRIPVFSTDELLANWDNATDTDDRMDAILALGLVAPVEPSPPLIGPFREALTAGDPDIRSAGLVAVSYTCWDLLKPLVTRIRAADPDEGVARRAEIMLDGWDDAQAHSRRV